jgi:hypothetical protein
MDAGIQKMALSTSLLLNTIAMGKLCHGTQFCSMEIEPAKSKELC